jgi:hypothetical protein
VFRVPRDADLNTADLHASQAITLCQRIMGDATKSPSDRALALCWLGHLVGDGHQPCHAGSLYAAVAFPRGDRGGNSVSTVQSENLHALWDGLLGPGYSETSENRRFASIINDDELMARGEKAAAKKDPLDWLEESRLASTKVVYTNEILAPVRAVVEGRTDSVPSIRVSPEYLETAGRMATLRAAHAGWRLAAVWREGLAAPIDRERLSMVEPAAINALSTIAEPTGDTTTMEASRYWLNTKTGVRHNAGCRNFENTKGGRLCDADEGKPCGICGG